MLLFLLLTLRVMAMPDTLSASDIQGLVQANDPVLQMANDRVALAEAQRIQASLLQNPQYNWSREHLSGETEEAHTVSLPVPLSTARRSRKLLAKSRVATAQAASSVTSSRVVSRALSLFYQTVALQQRNEMEQQALKRLTEATRVVKRQQEEGSVSGYDLIRVETAQSIAASRLRQTQNREQLFLTELYGLLGLTHQPPLVGTLDANPDISLATVPTHTAPPSLRMFNEATLFAEKARKTARWAWLPSFEIAGGYRQDRAVPDRKGYQMGVSVDLPFFAWGQGLQSQSKARWRFTEHQAESTDRGVHIALANTQRQLMASREDIRQFLDDIGDRSQRLEKAAESGYREGTFSIVELLDALQAKTELDVHYLELLLTAKEAEVDYSAARGEYE